MAIVSKSHRWVIAAAGWMLGISACTALAMSSGALPPDLSLVTIAQSLNPPVIAGQYLQTPGSMGEVFAVALR